MPEKKEVKFYCFFPPFIPSMHLRDFLAQLSEEKAVGVGAPCEKYLPTVPSQSDGLK